MCYVYIWYFFRVMQGWHFLTTTKMNYFKYFILQNHELDVTYYRNLNIEILLKRLNLKLRLACCKVSFELTIVTEVNDEA